MTVEPGLLALAAAVADWAAPAAPVLVYIFGSRARGDHRSDSDVDIYVPFMTFANYPNALGWWLDQNDSDFAALRCVLPGRLELLADNPTLEADIRAAPVAHVDRNVRCVTLPGYDKAS